MTTLPALALDLDCARELAQPLLNVAPTTFTRNLINRAMWIATHGDIHPLDDDCFLVGSQTVDGLTYHVTPGPTCTCPSYRTYPMHIDGAGEYGHCKHTLAVHLIKSAPKESITMPDPTASAAPVSPSPTVALLQEMVALQHDTNNRLEMVFHAITGSADEQVTLAKAIAAYFDKQAANASAVSTAVTSYAGANRSIIQLTSTAISHGVNPQNGKETVSIMAGEWQQFGVPAYPEVWPKLGFANLAAIPMGTTPWEHEILVQLTEDGKPKRVLGFASVNGGI